MGKNETTVHINCVMQKEINIRVVPEVAYQAKELKQHVARELGLDVRSVSAVQVRRRSIDAR